MEFLLSMLAQLQSASSLSDLAILLGYKPSVVSYIIFRTVPAKKYRIFDIRKKYGGTRTITAPEPRLSELQQRLSTYLYSCVLELKEGNALYQKASHGFQRERSIVSNAAMHVKKRYVFNIDLEKFFDTINFGRVRGFFIADRNFKLDPKVATVIAQIACHNNALPQGSPCSPIISNLIGNLLDMKLLHLASKNRCTYSRYADDLTFSTNTASFPEDIAKLDAGVWAVGSRLDREIAKAGFHINPGKTRMSHGYMQKMVTGLVVNEKVNIDQVYYRNVRAMCHSLFCTGSYTYKANNGAVATDNLHILEGMLSYIHSVKTRTDRTHDENMALEKREEFKRHRAPIDLYRNFLYFKYFGNPDTPLIYTEGKSDVVYLKCALSSLSSTFPMLAPDSDGASPIMYFKLTPDKRYVLKLGDGVSGQASLIRSYKTAFKKIPYHPMNHPVILVCDNDDGLKAIQKAVKDSFGFSVNTTSTKDFYNITENLYLVKTRESTATKSESCIEDLFPLPVLATKINGKSFDRNKQHGNHKSYGKQMFAEHVVRAKSNHIDFSGFTELLTRIRKCMEHHSAKP